MVQLVRYYHIPTGRNAGIVVAYGNWPELVLRHREWTQDRQITMRVATQDEQHWLAQCMRHQAIHYATVQELLEDEAHLIGATSVSVIAQACQARNIS